jgi:hypothetical protein
MGTILPSLVHPSLVPHSYFCRHQSSFQAQDLTQSIRRRRYSDQRWYSGTPGGHGVAVERSRTNATDRVRALPFCRQEQKMLGREAADEKLQRDPNRASEVLLAPPYLLEHALSSCGSVSSIGYKCAKAISERETDQ